MGRLFLSLTHLLGGAVGAEQRVSTGALLDVAAAACGGRVRINFVRSDLLLWTQHPFEREHRRGPNAHVSRCRGPRPK